MCSFPVPLQTDLHDARSYHDRQHLLNRLRAAFPAFYGVIWPGNSKSVAVRLRSWRCP